MARVRRCISPALISIFALIVLVGSGACKPRPGATCSTSGKFTCENGSTALLCQGGVIVSLPCRGPKGCKGVGAASECDDDLAEEGDNCATGTTENVSCSTDRKKELLCTAGKFTVRRTCKGDDACTVQGNLIRCDDDIGDIGDPCVQEPGDANYACSVDKKFEIVCRGNKFEPSNTCRGPKGCWIEGEAVRCDNSVARVGEICRPVDNNACSEDAKSQLHCSPPGKWAQGRECKGEGCKVKGNELLCD
jgi:hypothetical protein